MDNCDLETLTISVGKLQPDFSPIITTYRVVVESSVDKVHLKVVTSDCRASYRIRFGDESRTIKLCDGINKVEIEVVAEDGTIKKYYVEITKLSAKIAELTALALEGAFPLYPTFNSKTFGYYSTVPFHVNSVRLIPNAPDTCIKVKVNGRDYSLPILLNYGDTLLDISVCSADRTHSQVYTLVITREMVPLAVTFTNSKDQFHYECPVSLNAFYRPVSIRDSDPKHIFSRPYIEMLARRAKVDPLNNKPLRDIWKVVEIEIDHKMSSAPVKCLFNYKGCDAEVKLSELGSHLLDCPHKPTGELNAKVRNWENELLLAATAETNVEKLCGLAEYHLNVYKKHLPKPGVLMHYKEGTSPLYNLEQAAIHYASAIKLRSKESRLHFLLGMILEEQYYAMEMYGLKKKVDKDSCDIREAKETSRQDDILAVCKLHGICGTPTVENQLQALDKEYQQLKDRGQSSKADYVQTLYLWLSKNIGKNNRVALVDEEDALNQALMKYLDAWSLSPDCWEYNLHVGRLLLLQGKHNEALQHLQTGLALRPLHPGLRFFTGLAFMQQEKKVSEDIEKEAALFLHQGLEHFIGQHCKESWREQYPSNPLSSISTQFLRGLLTLGQLQQKKILKDKAISAEQVYHIVALLAAQSVSQCVCRGEASSQLECVLLDAHFMLLQWLTLKAKSEADTKCLVAKRCQAIIALIHFTSVTPCQKLLDMQESVCQLAVTITPRDNYTLCQLGLAQLAQYDSNPKLTRSQDVLADACASFQASIYLEGKPQKGDPPEELSKQKWWLDRQQNEKEKGAKSVTSLPQVVKQPVDTGAPTIGSSQSRTPPGKAPTAAVSSKTPFPKTPAKGGKGAPAAKIPVARGRPGDATKSSKCSNQRQNSSSKSKQESFVKPVDTVTETAVKDCVGDWSQLNPKSHTPRLGLARALCRAGKHEHAKTLYQELYDAYIELAQLLEPSDPKAAVEVYCSFPQKPVAEQTFDDSFITGEIIRILMKLELYNHPQLGSSLVAYGKVMGLSCIESYINILDDKSMTKVLRSVYAKIHDRPEDDPDLLDFFKFKGWI